MPESLFDRSFWPFATEESSPTKKSASEDSADNSSRPQRVLLKTQPFVDKTLSGKAKAVFIVAIATDSGHSSTIAEHLPDMDRYEVNRACQKLVERGHMSWEDDPPPMTEKEAQESNQPDEDSNG